MKPESIFHWPILMCHNDQVKMISINIQGYKVQGNSCIGQLLCTGLTHW